MKRILISIVALIFMVTTYGQTLKASYNVATYQAYDTTTFILGAAKDVKVMMFEFATVNTDDIVLYIGLPDRDGQGVGNINWNGSTVSPDSVILNKTTYTKKIRKSDGTRYSTTRVYLYWHEGLPMEYLGVTFNWKTAATGKINIYY